MRGVMDQNAQISENLRSETQEAYQNRQVTGSMKPCRVQASHEKSEAMSCAEVMRSMKPCSAAAEKSRAARSHKSLCVVIVH
ncbi:hypothetical protein Bca4012_033562 [Brassica carinata]